jgi:hypothetical protein
MEIKAEKFILELSHEEMWDTAFDVKRAIMYSIDTHWINHQDVWREHEKKRLSRCKKIFVSLGREDMFNDIFIHAESVFKARNSQVKE